MALLRNALLSLGATLAGRAANALVFLVLARWAGPVEAGVFSLGTTYLATFTALWWGLDELTLREVARAPEESGRYFMHLLIVRLVLGALSIMAMHALAPALGYRASTVAFLDVFAWSLVADGLSGSLQALCNARRRMGLVFGVGVLVLALKLGGGVWALAAGWGLMGVAWAWVAGSVGGALGFLGAVWFGLRPGVARVWPFDRAWWRHVVQLLGPFLWIGLTTILEWQTDVLLLSVWRDEREVGWYGGAMTIFLTLWLIPQAYRTALFPEMVRLSAAGDAQGLAQLYARAMRLMLIVVLPIAAGLVVLAPEIVVFLYKADFLPAALVLQILAVVLLPLFLNVPGVRLLMVYERQNWLAWFVAGSLAVNVGLNVLVLPAWGMLGAVGARVVSSALFFGLLMWTVRRYVPDYSLVRAAARPALAAAGMAAGVWVLRAAPVPLTVMAGGALYAGLAWAIVVRPDERAALMARVRWVKGT